MEITKEQMAERLNGREYRNELTANDIKQAQQNGLVIVYGASDDLMELEGAISEEFGTEALFDKEGKEIEQCEDGCQHYQNAIKIANRIEGHYGSAGWTYETKIPHATFNILEEGVQYCKGIVFSMFDLK